MINWLIWCLLEVRICTELAKSWRVCIIRNSEQTDLIHYSFIGFTFWKQNSRKFYAVPEVDLSPGGSSRKRKRENDLVDEKLDDIIDELDGVDSTLQDVKGKLDKVFALTKNTRVPLCFKQLISESFCCKICHVIPMKPPIIFALCCKTIVGCQGCVDEWYTSAEREAVLSKSCPACRGDRGYSQTVRLKGLDDLLKGVQPLFAEEGDDL